MRCPHPVLRCAGHRGRSSGPEPLVSAAFRRLIKYSPCKNRQDEDQINQDLVLNLRHGFKRLSNSIDCREAESQVNQRHNDQQQSGLLS